MQCLFYKEACSSNPNHHQSKPSLWLEKVSIARLDMQVKDFFKKFPRIRKVDQQKSQGHSGVSHGKVSSTGLTCVHWEQPKCSRSCWMVQEKDQMTSWGPSQPYGPVTNHSVHTDKNSSCNSWFESLNTGPAKNSVTLFLNNHKDILWSGLWALKTYSTDEVIFIIDIALSQMIVIIQDLGTLYFCGLLSKKYDYTLLKFLLFYFLLIYY